MPKESDPTGVTATSRAKTKTSDTTTEQTHSAGLPSPQADFRVENWKPIGKNTLVGVCTIVTPSGLRFHDVGIHRSAAGAMWASPASKAQIDRDGRVMCDGTGKRQYLPVVTFTSKAKRDQFSDAVLEALQAAFPGALS